MKSIAHAWVALMALERLKTSNTKAFRKSYMGENFGSYPLGNTFDPYFRCQADRFVRFFDKHKDAFVQGAWFPDSVISDNLCGGHTFKIRKAESVADISDAKVIINRTPDHLSSQYLVADRSRLMEKVCVKSKYVLPDRCEALSHAIRDMILIREHEEKGSNIMFNDDIVTLYFLMLSHYLADAHVPPHSDARDFYTPSTIHPDMEKYWDKEIRKYYEFDKKRKVFDYDIDGTPELICVEEDAFEESFLYDVLDVLNKRRWSPSDKGVLGRNNKKIYDYTKAVCFVSYLVSCEFIPKMSKSEYEKIKILEDDRYKQKLREMSVHVLADAIDSIALIWLLTWDRYNKLRNGIKEKTEEIEGMGGVVVSC